MVLSNNNSTQDILTPSKVFRLMESNKRHTSHRSVCLSLVPSLLPSSPPHPLPLLLEDSHVVQCGFEPTILLSSLHTWWDYRVSHHTKRVSLLCLCLNFSILIFVYFKTFMRLARRGIYFKNEDQMLGPKLLLTGCQIKWDANSCRWIYLVQVWINLIYN